jgi:hypothetical protein
LGRNGEGEGAGEVGRLGRLGRLGRWGGWELSCHDLGVFLRFAKVLASRIWYMTNESATTLTQRMTMSIREGAPPGPAGLRQTHIQLSVQGNNMKLPPPVAALLAFGSSVAPASAFVARSPPFSLHGSGSTYNVASSLAAQAGGDVDGAGSGRRSFLLSGATLAGAGVGAAALLIGGAEGAYADSAAVQDSLDVSNYLRTGNDSGGNMGVSSQAGKSRPQTGVVVSPAWLSFFSGRMYIFSELATHRIISPLSLARHLPLSSLIHFPPLPLRSFATGAMCRRIAQGTFWPRS